MMWRPKASGDVKAYCQWAFEFTLYLQLIQLYLSRSSSKSLIHAFVASRVDYCNSLLFRSPKYELSKLQRVLNASARLIYCAPKSCHITPLLLELH